MGLKTKMFKKKEMTEEQVLQELENSGIVTKSGKKRQEKFGAFRDYAQQKNSSTPNGSGPRNPYANFNPMMTEGSPYGGDGVKSGSPSQENSNSYEISASSGSATSKNAHGNPSQNPYGQTTARTAYGQPTTMGQSTAMGQYPHGSMPPSGASRGPPTNVHKSHRNPPPHSNGHGGQVGRPNVQQSNSNLRHHQGHNPRLLNSKPSHSSLNSKPSLSSLNSIPHNTASSMNISGSNNAGYYNQRTHTGRSDTDSLNFNDVPTDYEAPSRVNAYQKSSYGRNEVDDKDLDDLNEIPDEVAAVKERTESDEENDEVEGIKNEIRFVKQESLASTRNTIRLAQEAEMSGHNTLGMLGSQSERLFNTENNLALAETQTKIASTKVDELKVLNRSIFAPRASNPFNKKAKLRKQEEQIKADRMYDKITQENLRKGIRESEQRIKSGLREKPSEVHQKYTDAKNLSNAKRYQFENDSEDDEMEKELANNLDEIGMYANRLKSLALTAGEEVDKQNQRLKHIEEDADRLDIKVHMNTARLAEIR